MFRAKFLRKKAKVEERKDRVNHIIGAVEDVERLVIINEPAKLIELLRTIQKMYNNSHLKFWLMFYL
jgi:hypothetical protein